MSIPAVSVLTISRTRPTLLVRAIESVRRQVCAVPIEHLVLIDDCLETRRALEQLADAPACLRWQSMSRDARDRSGPGRSARLRNLGVRMVRSSWIAFIDDDNTWRQDHLQTLLDSADRSGCRAVHSQMSLLNPDGTPYLEPRVPWFRDPSEGREEYERLRRAGVVHYGSCEYRDRVDPPGWPEPVRSADTGEWLLARELLLELPFDDRFDAEDEAQVRGEDDKLLDALLSRGEPIAGTGQPTLSYYLGGYSNNFFGEFDATFEWR